MADRFLTIKKNLAGKRHAVLKEVQGGGGGDPCPIQVDDFNTATLENGKLYYLTQECTYQEVTYPVGYYTYNDDTIQRFDKVIVDLGEVEEDVQFDISPENIAKIDTDNPDVVCIVNMGFISFVFRYVTNMGYPIFFAGTMYRLIVNTIQGKGKITSLAMQAEDGVEITDGTIKHTNEISNGTLNAAVVSNASSGTVDGGTIKFKKATYDKQGHIDNEQSDDATLTIGDGLVLNGNTLQHTNKITQGSFATTYGTNVVNLAGGNYDKNGHITGVNNTNKISFTGGLKSGTTGTVEHTNSITASNNAITLDANTITFKQLGYDGQGHINSNTNGKVLTLKNGLKSDTSGNIEHSNSVTAQTTAKIYKTTVDAQGHHTGTQTGYDVATTISSSSTDTQLPTAKCMWTIIGNVEASLNKLTSGSGV